MSDDVVIALKSFRKVRIEMPECDSLREGKALVEKIQERCQFTLCYLQRLGENPELLVWRLTSEQEAMKGHEVHTYQC